MAHAHNPRIKQHTFSLTNVILTQLSRCWVPDDKTGWVGAEVISKDLDGEKVTLQLKLENGAVSIMIPQTHGRDGCRHF